MKIFAIGDLHLSSSMHKPMDIFGDKWRDHEAQLKTNWQRYVTEEDYVLIPGDISWAMRLAEAESDLNILENLPGKKICIRGNHDYWWDRPGKLNRQYESIYFLQNTAYFIGELAICGTRGWISPNTVKWDMEDERLYQRELERLKLSLNVARGMKEIWVMLHYPPTYNKFVDSPLLALLEEYGVSKVIYGHLHDENSWQDALQGNYKNITYTLVSADYIGFKPVEIAQIPSSKINGETI